MFGYYVCYHLLFILPKGQFLFNFEISQDNELQHVGLKYTLHDQRVHCLPQSDLDDACRKQRKQNVNNIAISVTKWYLSFKNV